MLINKSEVREVKGISERDKQRIMDFLQGAVYSWCKNQKREWFSARDFLGGDNYYWQGTPLLVLYEKHIQKGKSWEDSVKDAGKDAGWILKKVIDLDKRSFETKKEELIRKYRWTGQEDLND
jgi:hypothetical protein